MTQTPSPRQLITPGGTFRRLQDFLPILGTAMLRYGLVVFLLLYGGLKWTKAEADGIQIFLTHSPLFSWLTHLLSVQGTSIAIGVVELALAAMIASRRFLPLVSAWGSVLSIFQFLTTLSFLVTTPHLDPGTQGFLMKDVFLLGAAVYTAGEAFQAAAARSSAIFLQARGQHG